MENMTELERPVERALLIGLDTKDYDCAQSLDELAELAKTAGAEVCARMSQKRDAPDPATCIGSGRLEEAKLFVENLQITLVIFDVELSGSQLRNIEKILDCPVIDRTALILDIFAQRARSSEGRLQVELAQQRYRLPRLVGQGVALSRLGGGIGTRGPGETKLESDRRHIRRRIGFLEQELEEVAKRRRQYRERRKKDEILAVAIVGYTNVGKSTLLNTLTEAGVLAENMLFATLDPTARALLLPDGRTVMLVDTVGLIRRLPHMLVDAFRSTLEEACDADLILNVCDISSPDARQQLDVTEQLLHDIGAGEVPVLHVLNKIDQLAQLPLALDKQHCLISAKTGLGLDNLLQEIAKALTPTHTRVKLLLPYPHASLSAELRGAGKVFSEEFLPEGILLDVLCDNKLLHKCKDFFYSEE